MKKNYFIALLALVANFASAQIEQTAYRGAFAPAPTAMWTDSWTNWDPQNEPYTDAATVVNVTTNITTNSTWTTGKTYKISGLIYVTNNATLTIQAGVVVKGLYTNTGTALIVTKGAKLNAIGTASAPIVFTSAKPAGQRAAGDWGGIVLLGKAGFNLNGGLNNIEGITATVNTEYGGGATPIDSDNSGTMKYCRIEFPGFVFSPNNEINGLTLGSVGNGTTIDYVQVSHSGDDSFEWFGGSVNCKHLVSYKGVDDDFDTDNGYKGLVQFVLAVRDPSIADNPSVSTSEGFESDNNAAGSEPAGVDHTSAIFSNCTLIGPSARALVAPTTSVAAGHARALRLRRATYLKVYNSIFMDFKNSFLFVDGTAAVNNANAGNLKFKNNIIAGTPDATFTGGVNPVSLNSWFTSGGNSLINGSTGLLTKAYGTSSTDWAAGNFTTSATNLDYRPGTTAATGADFTDASIAPYVVVNTGSTPVVSNISYCKGAIAAPLTATLTTTGVSLKWYTTNTATAVALPGAPTPLTATVGTKTYYVSQVDASNIESAKVALVVTINALPTEVVSVITGTAPAGFTSAVAVGPNVGTTAQYTYSVTPFVDTTLSYLWTVPNGANIVSGQGTNTIIVNYLNVPSGAGAVGNVTIQAVNANGCGTAAKKLAITKALPAAPTTFKMYNRAAAAPTTAVTVFGAYMGNTTTLTLVAADVVGATSYVWSLPAGVNIAYPATGVTTSTYSRWYTAFPFDAPLTSAPSPSVGTKFWKIDYTEKTFDIDGVSTVVKTAVAIQIIKNGGAYGADTTQAYVPFGTAGTEISTNRPTITINFNGVTSSSTNLLYLGVKAKNVVGYSVTSNAAAATANPTVASLFTTTYTEAYTAPVAPSTPATSVFTAAGTTATTAKLLKITSATPAAVSTVTGQVGGICGGQTVSYTMVAATQASSYSITAPTGSVVTSASNASNAVNTLTTSDLTFSVTFPANLATLPATSKKVIIVSSNAVGTSTAAPKSLTIATTMAALTTPLSNPTTFSSAVYTIAVNPALGAVSYNFVLPAGATLVSQSANSADIDFSGVAAATTSVQVKVSATNSCGVTSAFKIITLTRGGAKMAEDTIAATAAISVYPNPATTEFNVDYTSVKEGVVTMTIYTVQGAVVSTKELNVTEGTTTVNENISDLTNGIYFVQFVNQGTNDTIVKKLIKR